MITSTGRPKILVLNGPNVGIVGLREPELYGTTPLAEAMQRCRELAGRAGVDVEVLTTNHLGELLDRLHEVVLNVAGRDADAIVVNPGGVTPYGMSLRDGLTATGKPVVVVHISNRPAKTDVEHRQRDIVAPIARGTIVGLGVAGYEFAVQWLLRAVFGRKEEVTWERSTG